MSINVERGSTIGMTQQILRHFDIRADRPKQGPKRMTKVVPADDFAFDPGAFEGRSNAFLQQAVRAERFGSTQPNRWKQEVAIVFVERLALPVEQRFQDEGMKRNRSA